MVTVGLSEAMQHAAAAYRLGKWDEVDRICRAVLAAKAEDFDALHLSGIVAAQTGRSQEAVALLSRAVSVNPTNASAQTNLGNALRMAGRYAQALERFDRAITLNPDSADACNNRGNALRDLGRPADALQSYDRAIALKPDYAEAYHNRGAALALLMRHAEALESYGQALVLKSDRAETHNDRGNVLGFLQRHEEALESFERAIALGPDRADPYYNRANTLRKLKRHAEALQNYDLAIARNPDFARAYNNRGIAQGELRRHADALRSYDRALELKPGYAEAHINRGQALIELQRHSEAVESCERALALSADYPNAHYNRGIALRDLHRHSEAVESFERAIALRPDFAEAHWNLANCLLSLGRFAKGWDEFEWRWKTPWKATERRDFPQPLWLGGQTLKDKTMLLHFEGGLGDTLQFCRYAKMVAARGATVVLEVQSPLLPVLADLEGVAEVLPVGAPLPAFDFHCPLMSLPAAFHTDARSIPAAVPYIRSDPLRVAAWRRKLGARTRTRVGLVWSGSKSIRNDQRSLTLEEALPIVGGWADWISLQKEVSESDNAVLAARKDLRHFGAELTDFGDTAALIELTDVVVTVDTSVAHLAGAMGKPLWILLPFNSVMWTWMLEREDSPWYPTARLFRQSAIGDWTSVIRRVGVELKQHFGTGG